MLIVAVVLLSMPSLFGGREHDQLRGRRVGLGLGLVAGCATLGILGAFPGFQAERRLGSVAGLGGSSLDVRSLTSLLASGGLFIIAWAATIRALRADA